MSVCLHGCMDRLSMQMVGIVWIDLNVGMPLHSSHLLTKGLLTLEKYQLVGGRHLMKFEVPLLKMVI